MGSRIRNALLLPFIIILTVIIAAGIYLVFKDRKPPEVSILPDKPVVSKRTVFSIRVKDATGIKSIQVDAVSGENRYVIINKTYPAGPDEVREDFLLTDFPQTEGPFNLEVLVKDTSFARFGRGNVTRLARLEQLDTSAPQIQVTTNPPYVRQGGSAVLRYILSEDPVSTGILVGELFFPGYKQPDGTYLCFFGFPYFLDTEQYKPIISATDAADNERRQEVTVTAMGRKFKQDTINLPDSFLNSKMSQFEDEFPQEMTNLERFLKVNQDLRTINRQSLYKIGRETSPQILWHGDFLRMPRAATTANFADHRQYLYNGQLVDEQTHLGVDLASTKNADVQAANDGKVIFAGEQGIYGLMIVLDHGLGVQTLYGHLSSASVVLGASVKKGDVIGQSGTTGLAGGDHLHFGFLVSGLPVTPVEWWDAHWIKDNITDRLNPPKSE